VRSIDRNREFQAYNSQSAVTSTMDADGTNELEEKARLVRERKAAQNQDSTVAHKEMEAWLNNFVSYLNQVREYHAKRPLKKDEETPLLHAPMSLLLDNLTEVCCNSDSILCYYVHFYVVIIFRIRKLRRRHSRQCRLF